MNTIVVINENHGMACRSALKDEEIYKDHLRLREAIGRLEA